MRLPPTKSSPPLGRSWPWTRRSSVVFPDPLGPVTSTSSPGATLKLTPFRTSRLPKDLTTATSFTEGSRVAWPLVAGRSRVARARRAPLPSIRILDVSTRPVVAGRLPTLSIQISPCRSARGTVLMSLPGSSLGGCSAGGKYWRRGGYVDVESASGRRGDDHAAAVGVPACGAVRATRDDHRSTHLRRNVDDRRGIAPAAGGMELKAPVAAVVAKGEAAVSRGARIHASQELLAVGAQAAAGAGARGRWRVHAPCARAVLLPRPEGKAGAVDLLLDYLRGQQAAVVAWWIPELRHEQRRAH